eukprot:gnl/MRDRNA2_/MRDRNA2_129510_c0_seq1.p1 gnl/MRDRNA2_/MRDRNA2_129510_c0~~gnl/MRDRNA2_/MRDRNA2_129510_c0_seq1.p1  ORF type:complete len:116 (+),score=26.08 gnl/MRDRNA2_/MRDRNA2_129510_c0_seq1:119-466(+)
MCIVAAAAVMGGAGGAAATQFAAGGAVAKDEPLIVGPPPAESTLVPGTVLIINDGDHAEKYGTVVAVPGVEPGHVALQLGPYPEEGPNGWVSFPLSSLSTVAPAKGKSLPVTGSE